MRCSSRRLSSCEHDANLPSKLSFITLFMWLLPHFAAPTGAVYRPPAASLFLLFWASFAILRPTSLRLCMSNFRTPRRWGALFFLYCLISAAYGYWNLDVMGKLTLHLTIGDVEYVRVMTERLLQLMLVLVAFEVVQHSRYSLQQLMRWWLQGMVGAVVLHILAYVITDDTLLQRAGTFNEGNLAGLYYLLSIFVALEYRRMVYSNSYANSFLVLAVLGMVLSRSTVGIILLAILLCIQYILSARTRRSGVGRLLMVFVLLPSIAIGLTMIGADFGIREKLFEEDVTALSFSRIDRLESISVAMHLFSEAPIFGQGIQTYGFLSNYLLTGTLQAFYDESFRRITNNIYAELGAELGLVGLFLFFGFVVSMSQIAARHTGEGRLQWLLGLTAVLLYWNAFPTYSVVFIWVFFGLILKSAHSKKIATLPPIY